MRASSPTTMQLDELVRQRAHRLGRKKPQVFSREWHRLLAEVVQTAGMPNPHATEADGREPMCFGYTRVSTEEQVKGLSLEAQRDQCEKFWNDRLRNQGVGWGGVIADEGQSAFKLRLLDRQNGRKLPTLLKAGDHLVIPMFDRAFRSMQDMVNTLPCFRVMQVHLHILDFPFDLDTASGTMMLQVRCAFAEFESRIRSERIKAAMRVVRHQGRIAGRHRRFGYKIVGRGARAHYVPDWEVRRVMLYIVDLYEKEGITNWHEISRRVHEYLTGRPPLRTTATYMESAWEPRQWTWQRCQRAYEAYHKICQTEGRDWVDRLRATPPDLLTPEENPR